MHRTLSASPLTRRRGIPPGSLLSQKKKEKQKGTIVGVIDHIINGTSKKKKKYTKYTVNDGTGTLTALIFDEQNGKPGGRAELKVKGKLPKKEGEIAAFMGKKYNNVMIIDDISPQTEKVYTKLAEVRNN